MKKSELRKMIRESIKSLIKEDVWQLQSDGAPAMFRFKGKTWPTITYSKSDKKIYARDDNGKKPSATLSTDDISVDGVLALLKKGISTPHPDISSIETFISRTQ